MSMASHFNNARDIVLIPEEEYAMLQEAAINKLASFVKDADEYREFADMLGLDLETKHNVA